MESLEYIGNAIAGGKFPDHAIPSHAPPYGINAAGTQPGGLMKIVDRDDLIFLVHRRTSIIRGAWGLRLGAGFLKDAALRFNFIACD